MHARRLTGLIINRACHFLIFMQTAGRRYEGDYTSAVSTNVWVLACTATGLLCMVIGPFILIITIIIIIII